MQELGRISKPDLRTVWRREDSDFTPWLAENLDALGEKIGMDLALEGTEVAVGGFKLDILARDEGSGARVVIENQLETTDHRHLGQLLMYASGMEAAAVVWVARQFREEHRQALDWLNAKTDTETWFFGVEVEAIQIDGSRPAPLFSLMAFPNGWQKEQHAQGRRGGATSPQEEMYREFYQPLIDELREKHRFTNAKKAQPKYWYNFGSGVRDLRYTTALLTRQGKVRVELYIDRGEGEENLRWFQALEAQQQEIEAQLGQALSYERLDSRRACRIATYRDGAIDGDEAQRDEIRAWMVQWLLRFKEAFGPRLERLHADEDA